MTDPLSLIRTLITDRPTEQQLIAPRTYRRRETWIPIAGETVTVWRLQSRDPDRQQAYPGVFVSATDESYRVLIDGEDTPCPFDKRDLHGARNWHLDHRGHKLETNK